MSWGSSSSTSINLPSASSQVAATYLGLHKAVMAHGRSPETSILGLYGPLCWPVPQFPSMQKKDVPPSSTKHHETH